MAALLSVALFPIGFVAVMQTLSVARTSEANAELALLSLTEQSAARERQALRLARGAAAAFSVTLPDLMDDPVACSRVMTDFVAQSDRFSFAGFVKPDASINCSSAGRELDMTHNDSVMERLERQQPAVVMDPDGEVSQTSILIIYTPVFNEAGTFLGQMTISVPHSKLHAPEQGELSSTLLELVTFNNQGEVLTSLGPIDEAKGLLPRDLSLTDLVAGDAPALKLEDTAEHERIYTVSAIEPGLAYALGVWDSSATMARQTRGEIITALFPALMWLAGLAVALFAVHRLVTRHLQLLGRQMALFTAARRLPSEDLTMNPPTEIRRIQRAFLRMTEVLIQDEASLENAVREKSVLVKEIHHRVKNNLQLISSIINMQIRNASSPEAKQALRQTQDRVLSMATIHRDLYQTNETGLVDVGHLIREVMGKTVELTPDMHDLQVNMDVEDIWLYPDQAVPMSLLASETVINALKHMPSPQDAGGPRWINVSLKQGENWMCEFRAENVARPKGTSAKQPRGMGRKLIQAFATQLGAKVEMEERAASYVVTVTFTASEFAPPPGDF